VNMHNSVDASLLGGAVIHAGDLVIDGSLKGRCTPPNRTDQLTQVRGRRGGAARGSICPSRHRKSAISSRLASRSSSPPPRRGTSARRERNRRHRAGARPRRRALRRDAGIRGQHFGLALNLERTRSVRCARRLHAYFRGQEVKTTGRILEVPVGPSSWAGWWMRSARPSTARVRSTPS